MALSDSLESLLKELLSSTIEESISKAFRRLNNQQNNQCDDDKYIDIEEAANYLKIKIPTLYGKTSRREIPFIKKNGKNILFLKSDLKKYLESGRCKTISELDSEAINPKNKKNNKRK